MGSEGNHCTAHNNQAAATCPRYYTVALVQPFDCNVMSYCMNSGIVLFFQCGSCEVRLRARQTRVQYILCVSASNDWVDEDAETL